jgi:hypothetical protein
MEFLRVADVGPGVSAGLGYGTRIEAADLAQDGFGKNAAHLDSASAALLEGSVVKVGVRIGV